MILLSLLLFYLPPVLSVFSRNTEPTSWIMLNVIMATFYSAVFCLNYFLIVPRTMIHADRKAIFFLVNLVMIMVICSFAPLWFESRGGIPGPPHLRREPSTWMHHFLGYFRFVIRDAIMMVLAAGLAYALRLSSEREKMRRRELELNAERRQLELRSLKAQLNPHFLFNSLNNIYALIAISPERAQNALHDLSGMLRFMIHDAASSLVPLRKELNFISDYVRLMRLRLGASVSLDSEIDGSGGENLSIAPLLFLTVVENAFKHERHDDGKGFIRIVISAAGDEVTCTVRNSCSGQSAASPERSTPESGVGLKNVERQLKLLYPGAHSFSTGCEEGVFTARISVMKSAMHHSDKPL